MFFNLKVLFYTFVFGASLELFSFNQKAFLIIMIFLVFFSVFISRKIGKKYMFSLIPIIFSFSSIALMYLIDLQPQRQAFILFASFVFYLTYLAIFRLKHSPADQTASGLISASLASTAFLFYSASYGIYLNFSIPLWALMGSFLIVTFLISFQYFDLISANVRKALNYSLILGMIMAEIAWIINFWPFGYLTTGAITLIFYYVLWDLVQSMFTEKLSQKRMIANLIFFGFLIGLVLASSKWLPVV
jgi:hypothetical protein